MNKDSKRFNEWNNVKTATHFAGIIREIKEGDVWWCSIGENVGIEIFFKDKKQNAVLAQARVLSVFRLRRKMGTLPDADLKIVREGFKNLYF